MNYPRIKKFNFNITRTYSVPVYNIGRLDKIAYELYNDIRFYKPLAYANNITLNIGTRTGIRPKDKALMNELIMKGYIGDALLTEYNRLDSLSRISNYDWMFYGDTSFGYVSDVYESRMLLVPDFASADTWLNRYEYLQE